MTNPDYTEMMPTDAKTAVQTLANDPAFVRELVQQALNTALEAEMTELLGAAKSERTGARRGYRSGSYPRSLSMKVGTVELKVPQDRDGRFSTEVFERYQRSEKALVSTLAEMYVKGVSTRKVGAMAERLCGHAFSAATISNMVAALDESLTAWAERPLSAAMPYLILDARYEKVREAGTVNARAVQIAVGIDESGRRHVLAVELATKESELSWTEFLRGLKARGLHGVEFVVSDSHEGLKRAIGKVLTRAHWQRCGVHFLRNASDKLPPRVDRGCLDGLKRLYQYEDLTAAQAALKAWVNRWGDVAGYRRLVDWVEENVEETFTVYLLPAGHRRRMKSTNMLERLNGEIRRRTRVVRIFPNDASCLRLIRALSVETHEKWLTGCCYLTPTDETMRRFADVNDMQEAV